jgi:16S rRNA (uracil1498-N3)-methyltransferase
MTRRRFIADEFSSDHAVLTGDHAEHLARVLRARPGQQFEISAGGVIRLGRIVCVDDHRVEFELGDYVPAEAPLQLTLALAIFKFDRMEWAIEKCTELGVSRILPFSARRTDAHLASAASKRVERWRRIAREASEQSRRIAPPEISMPMKIQEVFRTAAQTRIILSEAETDLGLKNALQDRPKSDVMLGIGPEGGWTEDELSAFQYAGWISASLGGTILRAETAAIAATAILAAELAE